MNTNPSLFVANQLPDFIATDVPRFIEFLEQYYKFAEQYNVRIESLRDLDQISDELLAVLKQEFITRFPQAAIDNRRLIATIRELYKVKGTFDSFTLLFRLFYNETITVIQPNKQILRASDGRWVQENSVTVQQTYIKSPLTLQQLVAQPIELKIVNEFGTFFVDVDRSVINGTTVQFFYRSYARVQFASTQVVDIVDNAGVLQFQGTIIKQPARLTILQPGKYWRIGQTFEIPGTTKPSTGVITSVGQDGEVTSAVLVEFGQTHTTDQIVLISPFPNKPISASDLEIEITGFDSVSNTFIYNYTLTLDDTAYTGEINTGTTSNQTYVVSGYVVVVANPGAGVDPSYVADTFLQQVVPPTIPTDPTLASGELTVEQWAESIAAFKIVFDNEVKYPGRYIGVEGQLSMPIVRLQDNYYYQLFSYAIESLQGMEKWQAIVNQIHPAGLKMFGQLLKNAPFTNNTFTINPSPDSYRFERTLQRYVRDSGGTQRQTVGLVKTSGGITYTVTAQVVPSSGTPSYNI